MHDSRTLRSRIASSLFLAATLTVLTTGGAAYAQGAASAYPTKPVRIVLPVPAGGANTKATATPSRQRV